MAFEVRRAQNDWRYDPVDRAWTVVARNRRLVTSHEVRRAADEAALLRGFECPLCAPAKAALDRERSAVALPSPSPLVFVEHEIPPSAPFVSDGALGAHEILTVPGAGAHGIGVHELEPTMFEDLFVLFSRRHADLGRDERLQSVSFALLPPPLSRTDHLIAQVLATPFPAEESRAPDACPLCDDQRTARAHGRVVLEVEGLCAWVPFAPRSTLHVRVAARHGTTVERLPPEEGMVRGWARAIFVVVRALARAEVGARVGVTVERVPLRPPQDGPPHLLASIENTSDVDAALGRSVGARVVACPPEETADVLRGLVAEERAARPAAARP